MTCACLTMKHSLQRTEKGHLSWRYGLFSKALTCLPHILLILCQHHLTMTAWVGSIRCVLQAFWCQLNATACSHKYHAFHGELHVQVHCFDPREYNKSSNGISTIGPYRAQFLTEAVSDLRENMRAAGSDLIVRCGKPEEVQLLPHDQQRCVYQWIEPDQYHQLCRD